MELRLISIANYENKPFYLFNEEFQDHAAKKKKPPAENNVFSHIFFLKMSLPKVTDFD